MKALSLLSLFITTLSVTRAANIKNLNEDDFFSFIDEHPNVFVKYCAPWYSKCQDVQSDYEKASEELKESKIVFAQVDCSLEQELCINNGVDKYPKFELHRDEDILEFRYKENTVENFKTFIQSFISPSLSEVNEETLETVKKENDIVILSFLKSRDSEEYQALFRISHKLRDKYKFVYCLDEKLAKKNGVELDNTIFIKKFNTEKNDVLTEPVTDEKLEKFIKAAELPLMDNLNSEKYNKYLDQDLPLFYFFTNSQEEIDTIGKDIEDIARNYRLKMNFIYVDVDKYSDSASNLGIENKWPAILIQDPKSKLKYSFDSSKGFDKALIQKFVIDYFDGKVKSFYHSEELGPRDPNDYLIRMNAYTFEEVALDITKDVFVLFYAEYCKPCRESIPILREIAAEAEPKNKIAIAYIDATLNDIPGKSPFNKIEGFPTFVLFRANRKNEPVLYPSNDYFKADYIDFITQYSLNDITFEKQEDDNNEDEEKNEEEEDEKKEKKDEL
ncbi:thioredoxin-like protein [Neocallimastix lanati (nom. inval.)]|jgi:protein disulfide isomerase|uniref:protein disulfide-isomerase n=1 Tax=Neocallimastix californiae TaxID=1754190 RepID=A0A1Y2DJJ6_9FUNG|nr:thioredoxin-like protein [Neocallimastix sp. JGI-2020a]ORY59402.1 thioredoxin-like protein [Neocallimastix californiae]|eukprot:ORY59402.1 thioredoxin-like protein [Neocallimastix californiae]